MPWIQCDVGTGRVKRSGPTQRDHRPDTIDYEVDALPSYVAGDLLFYDGTSFTVDSTARIAAAKAELEPQVLTAYRQWQDALAIPLDCAPMCEDKYLALKAELDSLGGN